MSYNGCTSRSVGAESFHCNPKLSAYTISPILSVIITRPFIYGLEYDRCLLYTSTFSCCDLCFCFGPSPSAAEASELCDESVIIQIVKFGSFSENMALGPEAMSVKDWNNCADPQRNPKLLHGMQFCTMERCCLARWLQYHPSTSLATVRLL